MTDNLILRKGISFLLILTLIFSGFFVTPKQAQAETQTITKTETAKFDDLAYYDVWKHEDGTWQKGTYQSCQCTPQQIETVYDKTILIWERQIPIFRHIL